jgi:hypothetical protein
MSFKAVLFALETKLEPVHKLVLVALASFTNHKTGRCDPKIRLVARYASVSVRTVHRIFRELEAAGVIITVNNFRGKALLPSSYIIPGASPKSAMTDTRGYDTVGRTDNHNLNQDINKRRIRGKTTRASAVGPENARDQACQVELARRLHRTLGWEMLMESEDQVDRLSAKLKLGTITATDLEEARQRYWLKARGTPS